MEQKKKKQEEMEKQIASSSSGGGGGGGLRVSFKIHFVKSFLKCLVLDLTSFISKFSFVYIHLLKNYTKQSKHK